MLRLRLRIGERDRLRGDRRPPLGGERLRLLRLKRLKRGGERQRSLGLRFMGDGRRCGSLILGLRTGDTLTSCPSICPPSICFIAFSHSS